MLRTKVAAILFFILLMLLIVPAVNAAEGDANDFQIDGTTLVKYTGDDSVIVIPDGITAIGKKAFEWNQGFDEVIIPEGVTVIREQAFFNCRMKKVTLPSTIVTIEREAFAECRYLESINLPDSITEIEKRAFFANDALEELVVPKNITIIREEAFRGCDIVTELTIPEGVTTIENGAFMQSRGITVVNLPSTLTSIGSRAFTECKSLVGIRVPGSVPQIGKGTFAYCDELLYVEFEDGVQEIAQDVFNFSRKLEHVVIPPSVTEIGALYDETAIHGITGKRNERHPDLVIYGEPGSAAEEYAAKYDITFMDWTTYNTPVANAGEVSVPEDLHEEDIIDVPDADAHPDTDIAPVQEPSALEQTTAESSSAPESKSSERSLSSVAVAAAALVCGIILLCMAFRKGLREASGKTLVVLGVLALAAAVLLWFFGGAAAQAVSEAEAATDTYEATLEISAAIDAKTADYLDDHGYIQPEDLEASSRVVYDYALELVEQGVIEGATIHEESFVVAFFFEIGLDYLYLPPLEGVYSAPSDEEADRYGVMSVTTMSSLDTLLESLKLSDRAEKCAQKIHKSVDAYDSSYMVGNKGTTVEGIKEELGSLKERNIRVVFWRGHGGVYQDRSGQDSAFFVIDEKMTDDSIQEYLLDLRSKVLADTKGGRFAITPDFIRLHMSEVDGGLFFSGTCSGMDLRGTMGQAIVDKGFDCYVGVTSYVIGDYSDSIMKSLTDNLCKTDADGNYLTIGEALDNAKKEHSAQQFIQTKIYKGNFHIWNNEKTPDFRLVPLGESGAAADPDRTAELTWAKKPYLDVEDIQPSVGPAGYWMSNRPDPSAIPRSIAEVSIFQEGEKYGLIDFKGNISLAAEYSHIYYDQLDTYRLLTTADDSYYYIIDDNYNLISTPLGIGPHGFIYGYYAWNQHNDSLYAMTRLSQQLAGPLQIQSLPVPVSVKDFDPAPLSSGSDPGVRQYFYDPGNLDLDVWEIAPKDDTIWLDLTQERYQPLQQQLEADGAYVKWGAASADGLIIPAVYDGVGYCVDGMIRAQSGMDIYYYDFRGNLVTSRPYTAAKASQYDTVGYGFDFSEGLAAVQRNGRWGYIDRQGQEVVPLTFEEARPVYGGRAWVKSGGLWGILDVSQLTSDSPLPAAQAAAPTQLTQYNAWELVSRETGNEILHTEVADFDGDGKMEAFVVTCRVQGEYTNDGCAIWFVPSSGDQAQLVRDSGMVDDMFSGSARTTLQAGQVKFFSFAEHYGGPGGAAYLYTVRDGRVYEPEVSGDYTDFEERDGVYYGGLSILTDQGRRFQQQPLYYDEATMEFFVPEGMDIIDRVFE